MPKIGVQVLRGEVGDIFFLFWNRGRVKYSEQTLWVLTDVSGSDRYDSLSCDRLLKVFYSHVLTRAQLQNVLKMFDQMAI